MNELIIVSKLLNVEMKINNEENQIRFFKNCKEAMENCNQISKKAVWIIDVEKDLKGFILNYLNRNGLKFYVFIKDYSGENVREYFKLGAKDVLCGEVNVKAIDIIVKKEKFKVDKLSSKNKSGENREEVYSLLYETANILRSDKSFNNLIKRLTVLLNRVSKGRTFFIIKDEIYSTDSSRAILTQLLENISDGGDVDKMREMLLEVPSFFPYQHKNKNIYSIPIMVKNSIKGNLIIVKRENIEMSNEELSIITDILTHSGILIENLYLREESKELQFGIIKSFSKAIEEKDKYTKGHSDKVAKLSKLLGEHLDLSEESSRDLERAAILHDIGKVSVAEEILNKKSKLNIMEFETIKKHPVSGFEIVSQIEEMKKVAIIIKHHHERWDGEGYPSGLKNNEIPLESRIISIADAYDAITSNRSYRKKESHSSAMTIIEDNSNSQFDPYLVRVFSSIEDKKILEIIDC